ncbi:helix-turn-helix domain-containing protein [Woeseia oceani]|uniref:helix-turn-helix domain-containing protein n=1 Tax=Woeseia oceani TaxID=1548547 RepID=UPI0018D42DEE|nr:helix-turn-helix domain-containing protein [Woeseia oceani]
MDYTIHTPRQLGQTLRGQRKSQKLTQKDAAKVVGLLPKTVSKLELAADTATVESLFKLLSALQLELVVRSRSPEVRDKEW